MKEIFMSKESLLGNLKLKNKFIRSATWEGMCENGKVTDRLTELYKKLSENSIGLIITGFASVSEKGEINSMQMAIYNDSFIVGLKKLTDIVHKNNSKISIQLAHCGGQAVIPEAPSKVKTPFYDKLPAELTLQRIKDIEKDFKNAAKRAVISGFDAIQIHAAHGYLISQFLSPLTNLRNDEYGGSVENRMRFLINIYNNIRSVVGKQFPVLVKINCEDFIKKGLTFKEVLYIVKTLENMGLDGVEVSGGMRGAEKTPILTKIDSEDKEAYWKNYSKKIKDSVDIPVILVGGLRSYQTVERLYNDKYADFFSFSRPLIKEIDLIRRWTEGKYDKSTCISCNKCFIPAYKGEGIKCVKI